MSFDFIENGKIAIIKMDKNNVNTPPSLLGIERKIAYTRILMNQKLISITC